MEVIMPTPAKTLAVGAIIVVSFLAGMWYRGRYVGTPADRHSTPAAASASAKPALQYTCPMHPQYRSDRPGDCPVCGMSLVPVTNEVAESDSGPATPGQPGMVQIDSGKQQMMGIRTEPARLASAAEQLRLLGRVTADERLTYKLNAAVDGWIREVSDEATTSNFVKKDQVLASYYAPEFQSAQQAYIFALGAFDRFQATGQETESQVKLSKASIEQAKGSLTQLGMTERQADEIAKVRQVTEKIRVEAPADGFILARNASLGQRFEKGTEFFRIADLSRVWVLADLFEKDAPLVKSSTSATIHYAGRAYQARVSRVPPVFDGASRTLKFRLEVANTGLVLRPDMFVDIEIPVHLPGALTVSSDSVVDSGRRTIVFVDRGNGMFEPRLVETGWRVGNRVEVKKGLMEGEKVVVSGYFLIDSESRLRDAALGSRKNSTVDPVCGMSIDPDKTGGKKSNYNGTTYYFCSDDCKTKFDKNPKSYLR